MTDRAELIRRLNMWAGNVPDSLRKEVTDLLEADAAEIARLTEIINSCCMAPLINGACPTSAFLESRCAELEALVREAVDECKVSDAMGSDWLKLAESLLGNTGVPGTVARPTNIKIEEF